MAARLGRMEEMIANMATTCVTPEPRLDNQSTHPNPNADVIPWSRSQVRIFGGATLAGELRMESLAATTRAATKAPEPRGTNEALDSQRGEAN